MRYLGGKCKIAKQIAELINSINGYSLYLEPFCGAVNVASLIKIQHKILNDKNPYLIAMLKAVQNGWIPPENVSKEEYYLAKKNQDIEPHIAGFVGFACSFAGKLWGSYAKTNNKNRNYAKQGKNSMYLVTLQLFSKLSLNKKLEMERINVLKL